MRLPPACEYGSTGYCADGRHGKCPYRSGGPSAAGIWFPECYITMPSRRGHKGTEPIPYDLDRSMVVPPAMSVIRPSHIYRCSCECHALEHVPAPGTQLELFTMEVAA